MQNGFLTIPHSLLNAAFRELTGGEFRLYVWLFRMIRGWHREVGSFGRRQLSKALGIDSKTIQRNREQLVRKGAIAYQPGSGNRPNTYRILDDFSKVSSRSEGVPTPATLQSEHDSAGVDRKRALHSESAAVGENLESESIPVDDSSAVAVPPLPPSAICYDQHQTEPATTEVTDDWSQEDIDLVRDCLDTAAAMAGPPQSAMPVQLLSRARRLGAEMLVLCRWILELGESKRRAGNPICSHQFFAKILDKDLPRYMLQNRNLVEGCQRRIPMRAPTRQPAPATPSAAGDPGPCRKCEGKGWLTYNGHPVKCGCPRGEALSNLDLGRIRSAKTRTA